MDFRNCKNFSQKKGLGNSKSFDLFLFKCHRNTGNVPILFCIRLPAHFQKIPLDFSTNPHEIPHSNTQHPSDTPTVSAVRIQLRRHLSSKCAVPRAWWQCFFRQVRNCRFPPFETPHPLLQHCIHLGCRFRRKVQSLPCFSRVSAPQMCRLAPMLHPLSGSTFGRLPA